MARALCDSCGLTSYTIQADTISCDDITAAVYSGRIIGTEKLSSTSIMTFLEEWVLSDTANVRVNNEIYRIDSTCPLVLDPPSAPVCSGGRMPLTTLAPVSTTTTTTSTTTRTGTSVTNDNVNVRPDSQESSITTAETGGLVIGVIIIVLLVVFIILLIVLLLRSFLCPSSKVR